MLKKTIFVSEILTKVELKAAKKLYDSTDIHKFAKECSNQIISPVIGRINKQLGQDNDPTWLAYAVEYTFLKNISLKTGKTKGR